MRIITLSGVVLTVALSISHAQQQRPSNPRVRFSVTLTETDDGTDGVSTLDVIFHRAQPAATQAEEVVRNLLQAAAAVSSDHDIEGRAWFQDSEATSEKKRVSLPGGVMSLVYFAADKTIRIKNAPPDSEGDTAGSPDNPHADVVSTILDEAAVKSDCKGIPDERVAQLAAVGAENRDAKRSEIVRAMRAFCKSEGVTPDRPLKVCMSAISKAALALETSVAEEIDGSPAALSRGLSAYGTGQCAKCHQASGKGGRRGPDLTDDEWLHCDGSVAGIRAVLVTGVPRNKLKDQSRPFGMNPVTNFIDDDQQMTDLAVYVRSLSQN